MTLSTREVSDQRLDLAGVSVQLLRGGSGDPLLVLHGEEGPEGWLAFHEALAEGADVLAPTHPGYGESGRPQWMETISHQAQFYLWFLQEMGLARVDLVGSGVGGWIAAEMAVMCPHHLRSLVLVGAFGIRPRQSEVLDIFLLPWREVVERCFYDARASSEYQRIYGASPVVDFGGHREPGRSMTMRTCYRPYMYNPALPALLGRLRTPTLVVWGEDDQIAPLECGRLYAEAIPGARLEVIERCGHWAHYERPQELARLVLRFREEAGREP